MAANIPTPVDEFCGLPLLLAPADRDLPKDNGSEANEHHGFHPSTDPILTGTLGGEALRNSRIQLTPPEAHNYGSRSYHKFYKGPPIPSDTGEQLGMCALAAAHYLSDEVIDTMQGEPTTRPVTASELERLRVRSEPILPGESEVLRFRVAEAERMLARARDFTEEHADKGIIDYEEVLPIDEARIILLEKRKRQAAIAYLHLRYSYDPMKEFFADLVLSQDVSAMPKRIRGRFQVDGNVEDGMRLLDHAANEVADTYQCHGLSVAELYRQAREQGRLNPMMPPTAGTLIANKLGTFERRAELLPRLREAMLRTEVIAA